MGADGAPAQPAPAHDGSAGAGIAALRSPGLLVPPTRFLGRAADLTELLPRLAACRLLTLTGPGGCGKTRLAAELVRCCVSTPDVSTPGVGAGPDVVAVGLDAITDSASVPGQVATALGLRDRPGTPLTEVLAEDLQVRELLLVLDNCEHVLPGVRTLLTAVLPAAPGLRVLATSRTVLGVPGEQTWPVLPLPLPPPTADPQELACSDAGRLFLDRAAARTPSLDLTAETARSIAALCRRLDGLPLALELAAGWLGTLTPQEIERRLDDSFGLLVDASGRPGRQRALRSAIAWSDALLEPAERATLATLSTFAGPFTLAEAEALTGDDQLLHRLRRLVESSWIVAEAGRGGTTYQMLNTLRAYGRDLLVGTGRAPQVQRAHALLAAAAAEESEAGLTGPEQADWQHRLDRMAADLDAALHWTREGGDPEIGLRLAAGLWRWWHIKGRLAEGRAWLEQLLTLGVAAPRSVRGRALVAAAVLAAESGDYDLAGQHAQSALTGLAGPNDHVRIARAHSVLGNVAKYRGDFATARQHLQQAVTSSRAAHDDRATSVNLGNLAALDSDLGNIVSATRLTEEVLALKRAGGDRRSIAWTLANLGDLATRVGEPERAFGFLHEAGEVAEAFGDDRLLGYVQNNLGEAREALDEPARAAEHYRRALALFRSADDARAVALAQCGLGRVLLTTAATQEGLDLLAQSEELAIRLGDHQRLGEVRAARAAPAAKPPPPATPAALQDEGRYWMVRYGSDSTRLRATKGLRYLQELLARPGVERHVMDLVDVVEGVDSALGDRRRIGDAGAALDAQAKAAYRRRIEQLRGELDDADLRGDTDGGRRAQEELEALVAELGRAVGLGGRDRRVASATEKARLNVTRAIRATIATVGEAHPRLGEHLDQAIRTGTFCSYHPPPNSEVTWSS